MVTQGSLTTPRAALEGHNPVWGWLAGISKTALCKIKGNSSCCASQHSLEQPGAGAACGVSDLLTQSLPAGEGGFSRVNHTCKSQGPRSKVSTGTAQGRAREGSGAQVITAQSDQLPAAARAVSTSYRQVHFQGLSSSPCRQRSPRAQLGSECLDKN